MTPQKLAIDQTSFEMAFGRDVDFHYDYDQTIYLDRRTGEVLWVYEKDEDAEMEVGIPPAENRALREAVAAEPGRYLEVPGRDHGEHHEILKDFLDSDWTEDDDRWREVRALYNGSIGRWKKAVGDRRIVHAFNAFQERRITELAVDFLHAQGIEPDWR